MKMNKVSDGRNRMSRFLARGICIVALCGFGAPTPSLPGSEEKEPAKVVAPDLTEEDAAKVERLRKFAREKAEAAKAAAEKLAEEAKAEVERLAKDAEREATKRGDAAPALGNEEEPDPTQLQGMEYFRRFSRGEVYLIHKCAELTPEQIQQLTDAGEKELKRLFDQKKGQNPAAEMLRENGIVRILPNGRRVNKAPLDMRSSIRLAISKSAETFLTPEQKARYQSEVEKRDLSRKRASIQMIVARIDRDLSFTTEQREKLVEVLVKSLNSTEFNAPEEILIYNIQNLPTPPLPPKLIEPLLTDSQKTAWRKMPKARNQINYDEMMMNNGGNLPSLSEEDIESLKNSASKKSESESGEATK